jgi:putative DNA methylase
MRVFSRYAKVIEADGSAMSVRTALGLINEVLGEVLSSEEAELDADSRFALTWFEQFGHNPGPYGDADVLARAKDTSVTGVVSAGVAVSRDGKVRLLERKELPEGWSPLTDDRPTVWESTQHLIRRLLESESHAADLLGQLGGVGDRARQLAYLLYGVCERKGWAEEAIAYNGLITAWPELARQAAAADVSPSQQSLI